MKATETMDFQEAVFGPIDRWIRRYLDKPWKVAAFVAIAFVIYFTISKIINSPPAPPLEIDRP